MAREPAYIQQTDLSKPTVEDFRYAKITRGLLSDGETVGFTWRASFMLRYINGADVRIYHIEGETELWSDLPSSMRAAALQYLRTVEKLTDGSP